MSKENDDIDSFELALKEYNNKKPCSLYITEHTRQVNQVTSEIKAKYVIQNVSNQIKAMQSADRTNNCTRKKKSNSTVKSSILPIQNSSNAYQQKSSTTKFDTQFATDTQLINVIEDAEAIAEAQIGITQEFEMTFVDVANKDKHEEQTSHSVQAADTTKNSVIQRNNTLKSDQSEEIKSSNKEKTPLNIKENNACEKNDFQNVLHKVKNSAESIKCNSNDSIPLSPILSKIRPIVYNVNACSLTYNLESFEQFEAIALPVIEQNSDIEYAKSIINSEILNKELSFQSNDKATSPVVNTKNNKELSLQRKNKSTFPILFNIDNKELSFQINDKATSPILNNTDNKELTFQINNKSTSPILNNKNPIKSTRKCLEIFDDVILSCSGGNVLKDENELPLTCALQTSFYDKSDILDTTMYVGFQTASNKSIQVLSNSYNKARTLFDSVSRKPSLTFTELVNEYDINSKSGDLVNAVENSTADIFSQKKPIFEDIGVRNDIISPVKSKESTFKGFQTASNKKVHISEEALLKSNILLTDIDNVAILKRNNRILKNDFCQGFQTAGGTKIKISEDALLKSKQILKDIVLNADNKESIKCLSNLQGFKTASDRNINISEEALLKSKMLFTDIMNDGIIDKNEIMLNNDDPYKGFQTASGKKFKISEEALSKSKHLFEDIDTNVDFNRVNNGISKNFKNLDNASDNKVKIKHDRSPDKDDLRGFQTASGKTIRISEEAFSKSKHLFEDIDTNVDFNIVNNGISKNFKHLDNASDYKVKIKHYRSPDKDDLKGFQTASGKTIKISEEAFSKSKHLFEDIDTNVDFNIVNNGISKNFKNLDNASDNKVKIKYNRSPGKDDLKGFQTASGKKVRISEEALSKCKNVFKAIDINVDNKESVESKNYEGLQTVQSDKKLHISEETLLKSTMQCINVINDDGIIMREKRIIDKDNSCMGFQTANGKKVKISEEALSKSKYLFKDIDINTETRESIECVTKKFGFQTASDKKICISKEAILKSEMLFSNIINNDGTIVREKMVADKDNSCMGFQTASGKKVKISEEAVSKSKNVFHDIDINFNNKETIKCVTKNFEGFKTASDKKVNICDQALLKSKMLFTDILNNDGIIERDKDISDNNDSCKRFQTASGKKVNISEEALSKSKKIIEDIDFNINQLENTNTLNNQFGLNTVDNIKVTILKEASLKPNQLNANTATSWNDTERNSKDTEMNALCDMINTEVLKDFEVTLYTEDFSKNATLKCKRSGSPILPCPRPKKIKIVNNSKSGYDCYKFAENYKKTKCYSLKSIIEMESQSHCNAEIDPYLLSFNFETISKFIFYANRNEISNDNWSIDKVKKFFEESVKTNIIPARWVENHMKLVIWKLLLYEIIFPNCMKNICSVKNVLEQLKYRYDRELYNVERPALRKILEKDIDSTRRMVLHVVSVTANGVEHKNTETPNVELLLTDGWYCVTASLDGMLTKLVLEKKIYVGTKLFIHGAELVNCDQGMGPLEDTSLVRLKLFGNSTRRARFDTRLGFHGNGAILTPLACVKPDGGKISRLRVLVTRVYPMLYVERFSDGSTVTRSERLEHLYQNKFESEQQTMLEKIYEEIEKEVSEQESQDSGALDFDKMEGDSQIRHLNNKQAEDDQDVSNTQIKRLQEYSAKRREKLLEDIQMKVQERLEKRGLNLKRNVVPLLKIRVVDSKDMDIAKAMLTVWRPDESLYDILKEGTWVNVFNVTPTGVRYSEMQMSAGRQSMFQKLTVNNEKMNSLVNSIKRKCYTIKELVKNPTAVSDYNEIDTFGLIFLVEPTTKEFQSTNQLFQNVYLSDADKNIICINFWGGIKKFGYENILDTGQIVTCVNLQKRSGNTTKNIPHYRATEFTYFTKTPKMANVKLMVENLTQLLSTLDRRKFVDDCILLKNNYSHKHRNTRLIPNRFGNDLNTSRSLIQSPINKDYNLNLTGLDFESTFKQETQEEISERLKRKRKVDEKIAKLNMYGDPPPLSSIHIFNKCKNVENPYKSPLGSNNYVARQETIDKCDNSDKIYPEVLNTGIVGQYIQLKKMDSSPVANHTDLKKNIKPVKLNFCDKENSNSLDDPFGEDFDGSLPLSLDSSII